MKDVSSPWFSLAAVITLLLSHDEFPGGTVAAADTIGNAFISAFETLGIDPELAKNGVVKYATVNSWIASQVTQTAAIGGLASAVPGLHHAGAIVDVTTIVHKMALMTWGIGFKLGAGVDPKLDLANVLALWAGAISRQDLRVAGAAAATAVAGPAIATAALAKGAGSAFAIQVAQQIAGTAMAAGTSIALTKAGVPTSAVKISSVAMKVTAPRVGAKIAAKMGAKHIVGWVPVVGAAAGAGINIWIMKALSEAGKTYYSEKISCCH